MSSAFGGLIGASQALSAQQYGLDVTGQNINNADTPGYSRQSADFAAVGPASGVPSLYATQSAATGVQISGTTRIDDPILDGRVRTEHGVNNYAQTASAQVSGVQALFDEPSDSGLAEQLNTMWNSWSALANNPGDSASRSVVLQAATTVTTTLNSTSAAITSLTQAATSELNQNATDINTAAASLAKVNSAISISTATGANHNALDDQRDSLLLTLANLGGVQTTIQADGSASVSLGGQTLVSGGSANTVAVTAGNQLTVGGNAASTVGGSAQAYIDTLNTTLPGYSAQLDAIASKLAGDVNSAQAAGYDLSGTPGTPLFSGTTAATITVAITDPTKLAASGTAGGNLDGSNAAALGGMGASTTGADAQYATLVSGLGSAVASASQTATVQASVATSLDAQQQSVSGVSIDEETVNLLTFQRAYQASSRVLTTIDSMLDQLINHTGTVGL
ncbi:MAG: flagellar hook-associated protein FlgK [Frankiales bacterium]|nr:flagellar hook-associated protein FlgK [Frankiales bacterium]